MVKILLRAFRRARIPLRFSKGFHPAPKVSFNMALPVGLESSEEYFSVEVPLFVKPSYLLRRVNAELPQGLHLTACEGAFQTLAKSSPKQFQYTVTFKEEVLSEKKRQEFMDCAKWLLERKSKKGRVRIINLKELVTALNVVSPTTLRMTLDFSSGKQIRPTDALENIFGLSQRQLKLASILKEPLPG
jgi:radical SAM-linked protein